jgi:nucleoside-triphosphatase
VGKYGVNLQDIDKIAVPAMIPESENLLIVVDEIGKMECFSTIFRQTLTKALDSANPVIGSIALKGDAFISAIKKRPDTRLIPVSERNRDILAEEILGILTNLTEPYP